MRRVKTLTLAAGPRTLRPGGVRRIGTILELPDDEAEELVKNHYAEYVGGPLPDAAAERAAEPEMATAEAPEAAVSRRGQRRRAGRTT